MTCLILVALCLMLLLTIVPHIFWHFKRYKEAMFFRILACVSCACWVYISPPCLGLISLPEWTVPVAAIFMIYNYFALILEMVIASLKED